LDSWTKDGAFFYCASILARVETAHRTALIRCGDYSGSMSSRPASPAVALALAALMYRVKRGGKNDLRIENNSLPQLDAGSIAKSA
jgi:hypothetical protein